MIRKFEFNAIYIIESLKDDDKATGTILYEDLLRRQPYKIDFVKTGVKKINTKQQLFLELEEIKQDSLVADINPFLHFEIHGSSQGLVLNSKQLVTWNELTNKLREINILIKNNLFVSFATCHSAYIYQEVKPFLPAPFFAFIGSWAEVTQDDVMKSFYNFFESIFDSEDLSNIDLQKAVKKLNEFKEQPKYYFYNSEQIFNRAMADYEKDLANPILLKRRIARLVEGARKNQTLKRIPIGKLEEIYRHLIINDHESFRKRFKQTFLMR